MKRGLTLGAEINSLGEKWTGWTALHHAADAGQEEVVRFLLDQGADTDRLSLDYAAHTALHLAVSKRHYQVSISMTMTSISVYKCVILISPG